MLKTLFIRSVYAIFGILHNFMEFIFEYCSHYIFFEMELTHLGALLMLVKQFYDLSALVCRVMYPVTSSTAHKSRETIKEKEAMQRYGYPQPQMRIKYLDT